MLAYASMVLLLFPLSCVAVMRGGFIGIAFVLGVMMLHIVLDNGFGPIVRNATETRGLHDLWLNLQLPCALLLLSVLVLKSATPDALAELGIGGIVPYRGGFELWGAIVATAFMYGGNTVVAHEFMHRREGWSNGVAWALLVLTGDAQFVLAHVHGHHINVGTPVDAATARRGESLYRFFLRSTRGQYAESFALEARRLQGRGALSRVLGNRVLWGVAGSLALAAATGALLGVRAGLSVLGVMVLAKLLLEAINYIQHYGLVRIPGERVLPRHSWDCVGRGAGYILFGLSLHADHHANPVKPLWLLAPSTGSPRLKHGYMLTLVLAFVPSVWFRYMKKPLADWDETMASPLERSFVASSSTSSRAQAA
jgi:alkane 1-monooxygenase